MKYLADLQKFFHPHKDEANAAPMKKYMKDRFEFLGIKAPERKALLREFHKENEKPTKDDVENIVVGLYSLPYREFHYIAIELVDKLLRKTNRDDIYAIEYLLEHNQWWDTIDFVASNIVGRWMSQNPESQSQYFNKWVTSSDMWLNRTAILYQLKYRDKVDKELLIEAILRHCDSKDFFHQKAIGWALREYARQQPEWVKGFVANNQLSRLSKREALKHFKD